MTTPAGLAAHVKHVFESSRQREVLVRMAEAIELLNERCACANTIEAVPPFSVVEIVEGDASGVRKPLEDWSALDTEVDE